MLFTHVLAVAWAFRPLPFDCQSKRTLTRFVRWFRHDHDVPSRCGCCITRPANLSWPTKPKSTQEDDDDGDNKDDKSWKKERKKGGRTSLSLFLFRSFKSINQQILRDDDFAAGKAIRWQGVKMANCPVLYNGQNENTLAWPWNVTYVHALRNLFQLFL